LEGLQEASIAQGNGTIIVFGSSHTQMLHAQVLPYLQRRQGSLHRLQ
jgi:hypothetical protein